jgi:hypothetical protein
MKGTDMTSEVPQKYKDFTEDLYALYKKHGMQLVADYNEYLFIELTNEQDVNNLLLPEGE